MPTHQISDITINALKDDADRHVDWFKSIPLDVDQNLFLAGPSISPDYHVYPRYHDNFHYPLNMRRLLSLGFPGIRDLCLKNAHNFSGNQKRYLLLIAQVYTEIIKIVENFAWAAKDKGLYDIAEICGILTKKPPATFLQACQLYWLAVIFRIGTATIGRIDQHLYPFYKSNLEKGIIDQTTAKEIISELFDRFERRGNGKGDTLQIVTLGGQDESGNDMSNELSRFILERCLAKQSIEPKMAVRINMKTPKEILNLVAELQFKGTGICTVFNDDAIIAFLKREGRPIEAAVTYCSNGCSEVILDGLGEIGFRYIDCIKAVEHVLFNGEENIPHKKQLQYYSNKQDYADVRSPVEKGLKTGDFLKMEKFNDFYNAYLKQIKYQIDLILKTPYNSEDYPMRLFTAATMPNVIETACEPYTNPACLHSYWLFIGSLANAANSIAAVKSLVYEKKLVNREDLLAAISDNFENNPALKQRCRDVPKFGNDDDYVDRIAVDIAKRFSSWVREYKDRQGRSVLPGLYNHLFHHTAYSVGATPDGRKFGEPIGEHFSPVPGTASKGPTAIINSVCKINEDNDIIGATVHLHIPASSLKGIKDPYDVLTSLNKVFCEKKGFVLNVNVLDSEKLKDAQRHPEKYKDLIVRVWGFSHYFTQLSKEMQDHVISRFKDTCKV